jgi:hypothetical protein
MEINTDYNPNPQPQTDAQCRDCVHVGIWYDLSFGCGYPFKNKFLKNILIEFNANRLVFPDYSCDRFQKKR